MLPDEVQAHYITLLGVYSIFALILASCTLAQSDSQTNTRPACVTLDSYSYAIEQVMNIQSDWKLLKQSADNSQYQCTTEDKGGKHTLSATLTSDECVCATVASSHFRTDDASWAVQAFRQCLLYIWCLCSSDYTFSYLWESHANAVTDSCGFAQVLLE